MEMVGRAVCGLGQFSVLEISEWLKVGDSYPNHRQEVGRNDGPLTLAAATHHLDGVCVCTGCNSSISPAFHEHGSFIWGTLLHYFYCIFIPFIQFPSNLKTLSAFYFT